MIQVRFCEHCVKNEDVPKVINEDNKVAKGQNTRLTNSSEETPIGELLSGDTVFSIPYFQRPYKWKPEKLKQLNSDILAIVDERNDFHFLGAVIIHGRRSNPADPTPYDVIDGQQRITTLYLYICAIVKFLSENDKIDDAVGLFLKYLVINRKTKLISNFRLHSCKEDRSQLNYVIEDILSNKEFKAALANSTVQKMPTSGTTTGKIRNNYKSALRFLNQEFEQGGMERIESIYEIVLQKISVVQIDVLDPTDGPKIFDSLNSRQEPMTIGDLVRNEIFSKVASDDPENIEVIDQETWQPFYTKFKDYDSTLFDKYFFPYGLIQNQNLKKSEVYNHLQEEWKVIREPEVIIEKLAKYQNDFIDITQGTNECHHSKEVHQKIVDLKNSNIPSSTYPFLMQLSYSIRMGNISSKDGLDVLSLIESFLVRRALCGFEPTGLHAVFKRLWVDCADDYSRRNVKEQIQKHKTVTWPTDDEVINAVKNRALYGSAITKYFLLQYDKSLNGDQPTDIPWIEHILPQKPEKKWWDSFPKDKHEHYKDILANLIPLSKEMNQKLTNKVYSEKVSVYRDDSMFKSTRQVAVEHDEWGIEQLHARGDVLAKWAVSKWEV